MCIYTDQEQSSLMYIHVGERNFFILKGVAKKPPFQKFATLAYFPTKKMIYFILFSLGYGTFKLLAIVHDFIAHWAIKNKQMANSWNLNSNLNKNS